VRVEHRKRFAAVRGGEDGVTRRLEWMPVADDVDVVRGDGNRAPLRHRIARVDDQIQDHLLDLPAVSSHASKGGGGLDLQLDVRADQTRQHARQSGCSTATGRRFE
jgi:hypothetical protein